MVTCKFTLCVVLFITYSISHSNATGKRRRRVHAVSTFQSRRGPTGPPRTRAEHQGDDEEDYYDYYDDNESTTNTTPKSLSFDEMARKRTARPPGIQPPQAQQTIAQFTLATEFPRVGRNVILRSGKEISSLRGRFASLPSLPLNDVFITRIAVPVPLPSSNLPSSQPNFRNIGRSEPFPTLGPALGKQTSAKSVSALNSVGHEPATSSQSPSPISAVASSSDRTLQLNEQTTDMAAVTPYPKHSFVLNHRGAFQILSVPSNDFRVSEGTAKPQQLFSVSSSVRSTDRPTSFDDKHLINQKNTTLPSPPQSSKETHSNPTVASTRSGSISTASHASQTGEKIIPNGVLSFTDAASRQAFRVGHNIVRINFNANETTVRPLTTAKVVKKPVKSTFQRPLPVPKKIDLETSEFSESPFSYYGGGPQEYGSALPQVPQEYGSALPQVHYMQNSKIETRKLGPSNSERHSDWNVKHSRMRPSLAQIPEYVRTYQVSSAATKELPGQTKAQVEIPHKPTIKTDPSKLLPKQPMNSPQESPAFVVGSPSLHASSPPSQRQSKAPTSALLYGESPELDSESELQSTNAFIEEHQTFRIDVARMRKILDQYLPKSAPSLRTSNTVTEGFAQEAFNENQRNKLIDSIISAIESVQKFSESVRREMRQVLRDSFIPNLPNERLPVSSLLRKVPPPTSKFISAETMGSDTTSDSSVQDSKSNEVDVSQQVMPHSNISLLSETTRTASVMTTDSLKMENTEPITTTVLPAIEREMMMSALSNDTVEAQSMFENGDDDVFLPWRTYRNTFAITRYLRPDELRALRQ
ncbi:hypothetical protein Tcan_05427 [Toxocara canis]|uniref:Uncharacterized protein n=1 Tax=Toxocara canis TaxID=6265 RepID=A0A0B2VPT8_TOXCA|nr:hypothetical protein Tcan_05427 [Toxocara canis]